MSRSPRWSGLLSLALLACGAQAGAQIYYPSGYGGYGFGGWGGGGTTPQGDIARGMGAFAAGAGYYNEQTAEARAINANTARNWNEYWYQSQQNVNRHYYAKLGRRQAENVAAQDAIYARLRDNPNPYDIYRGDALNVVFDMLSSPKVYINGLKGASQRFPGEMIREIPFQYASEAVTATVHSVMTKGSAPEVLKRPAFRDDLAQLREMGEKIRQEDEAGDIDPETIDRAVAAIQALQKKADAELPQGSKDRTDADRFLKAALGLTKMLRTPAINVLLADVDKHPDTTVGDLLSFMKAFNLRFGVADHPREKMVYDQLYPLMLKLRDEAYPGTKPSLPAEAQGNFEHPAEFFATMDPKALDPNAVPPSPRPARPR